VYAAAKSVAAAFFCAIGETDASVCAARWALSLSFRAPIPRCAVSLDPKHFVRATMRVSQRKAM